MKHGRRVLAFTATLLGALASLARAEGTWKSLGPGGIGWVSDVAVTGSTAYAATSNGVFRSDDDGATWRPAGLTGEPILQIVARTGAPAAFARAYRGYSPGFGILHVTRDGGATWAPVDLPPVLAVALDPDSPSVVYAALNDGRLARSADAGATWDFPSGLPGDGYAWGFAFGPSALYIRGGSGIFKSPNGGASWTGVSQPGPSVTGLFNGKDGVLYTLGDAGRFCRSTDGASSWTCSSFPGGYLSSAERILELPAEDGGASPLLLAITSDGLLSSRDAGATWTRTQDTTSHDAAAPHGLASDDSGSLVLAGSEKGILRSLDRGETWTPLSAGLRAAWIDTFASDPRDASRIWAAGAAGLFRTTNRGLSWSDVDPFGLTRVGAIAVDPTRTSTVYVAADRVYRTDDGGETWTSAGSISGFVNTLTVDPGSPQTLWATAGDLYKSEDGASSFHYVGSISQAIQSILFDEKRPGQVYAGGFYGFVEYGHYDYPNGGSIFVSYDRGATFTQNGLNFDSAVIAIVQDPHDGVLYAATYEAIFRSGDGGTTWQLTNTSPPRFIEALVADPKRPGQLYAGTTDGVYRTLDGGATWALLSTGLAHSPVAKLAISPDGALVRAATSGGGVFELELDAKPPSFPCVPSGNRLCLVGNRYAVDLVAARKGQTTFEPGAARPLGDRAGYFGLPSITGDPDLPEVVVKMLADGSFGHSGAPFFYSSLTTVSYRLTVTDTMTGEENVYVDNPGQPLCGRPDLLFDESAAPPSVRPKRAAAAEESSLRLLGGRFSVTLEARRARDGRTASGVVTASGDAYGIFSLPDITGDPDFPEVAIKMVDARSFAGHFWFFHSSLTSLDYTLTVTDSVTGAIQTYASATPFCGAADTEAFTDEPPNPSRIDLNGFWSGTMSFPTDCFTCAREDVSVTLSQVGSAVTGHFTTACLGYREILGALDGDQLSFDFKPISGTGSFSGSASSTSVHVEKNCDPWGYGSDYTMGIDLSR